MQKGLTIAIFSRIITRPHCVVRVEGIACLGRIGVLPVKRGTGIICCLAYVPVIRRMRIRGLPEAPRQPASEGKHLYKGVTEYGTKKTRKMVC